MRLPFISDPPFTPVKLTDIDTDLDAVAAETDTQLIRTKPTQKGPGEKYAEELIESFHETYDPPSTIGSLFGSPEPIPRFSYELWFDGETLTINWGLPDDYWRTKFRENVIGEYPNITLERISDAFIPYNPDDYVAGGTLKLKSNPFIPIKQLSGLGAFEDDKAPMRLLTTDLAADKTCSVYAQVLFRSARTNWRSQTAAIRELDANKKARYLKEGRFVPEMGDPRIEDPTQKDRDQAQAITNHEGEAGFKVTIRYFVFGPEADRVKTHVKQIGDAYRATYKTRDLDQGFTIEGFYPDELETELTAAINREFTTRPDPYTISELAALAHIPNGEIDTPELNWTTESVRSQVPSDVPRKVESRFPTPNGTFDVGGGKISDSLNTTPTELPSAEEINDPFKAEFDVAHASELESEDTATIIDILDETLFEIDLSNHAKVAEERTIWDEEPLEPDTIADKHTETFRELSVALVTGDTTVTDAITNWPTDDPPDNLAAMLERAAECREEWRYNQLRGRTEVLIENHPDKLHSLLETALRPNADDYTTTTTEDGALPDTTPEYDDASITPIDAEYEWQEDPHTKDDRAYEIKVTADDGNVYLGRDPKAELFDIHDDHPDSPLWLGWVRDNRVGVREVGLEKMSWFRHMSVFGLTGTGKSTFNNNLMIQIAKKGYGFCYIDPKGDGVREILTQLPEDRKDDIIWIEPGSPDHDKVVGINFLEAAYDKDHPDYDREVTAMIDDLTSILKGGGYWGPKMEGITTNIARAMIRSEIEFNLMDMYYVLRSDKSRQAFAENIKKEGEQLAKNGEQDSAVDNMRNIATYTRQIAEMDSDEVDAVIRRIQTWVEDPIARGVVAHREGTVNITEAVENGKIILVNVDIDSRDIKDVVATAIMRRVWAAIKARREDESERSPFFSFLDEFDDIASEEMEIEKMLSKARSGKMGVNLTLQNPSQVPDKVRQQMFSNARTVNSFGIGERTDADLISTRFPEEVEYSDIMEIPQFTLYTRLVMQTDQGRRLSPTLPINSFADYPPVRSNGEARELVEESLDKYGVEPLTETLQDTEMVLFNMGNNVDVHNAFLQAVWEVQIDREVEYASLSAVSKAFKARTGKEFYEYPNGIQIDPEWCDVKKLPEQARDPDALAEDLNEHVAASGGETTIDPSAPNTPSFTDPETNAKGEITIEQDDGVARITPTGKDKILESDHQYVPPSEEHNDILKDGIFEWFTRIGFEVNIVTQKNKESLPDAEGYLPVKSDTATLAEARREMEKLEAQNELLAELSDGKEVAFEAEYALTNQESPIKNLTRAANNNRRAIFMVNDGRGDDRLEDRDTRGSKLAFWARRLDKLLNHPPLVKDYNMVVLEEGDDNTEQRTQVERTLYNTSNPLRLSIDPSEQKFPVIEKDANVVWIEQDEAALVLRNGTDEDATVRGSLGIDGLNEASANSFSVWTRYDKYEDEWVVYPEQASNRIYETKDELLEDWQLVNRPFHPRTDIGPDYTELDPLITILPAEKHVESPDDAVPLIYNREDPDEPGTVDPLVPAERLAEWDDKHLPRYNPIDTTPEALQGPVGNDDRLELTEFLDTYELSEMNLNALIPDTDAPYDPQHTPGVAFSGNKTPTERRYWEAVFAACASANENIQDIRLSIAETKTGIKQGLAQMDNHDAAIKAGVKSGQLCVLNGGLILAKGWDRPKVVLKEPERYAQRSFWTDVYEQIPMTADPTDTVPKRVLPAPVNSIKFGDPDDHRTISHARAAIAYAIKADTLIPTTDAENPPIKLCAPGRPDKWKRVWQAVQESYDKPLDRDTIAAVLPGTETDVEMDFDAAYDHIEQAIYNQQTLKETESGLLITPPGKGGPLDPDDTPDLDDDPDGDTGTPDAADDADHASGPSTTNTTEGAAEEGGDADRNGEQTETATQTATTTAEVENTPNRSDTTQTDATPETANESPAADTSSTTESTPDDTSSAAADAAPNDAYDETDYVVEGVTTEDSIEAFADRYLTTDVDESDTEKPEYDYPRVPVDDVWTAYERFCEINEIDAKDVYAGAKKEIAEQIGIKKKSARWEKGEKSKMRCYSNAKLTPAGRLLADNR